MPGRAHGRRYLGLTTAGAALTALALSPLLAVPGTANATSPPPVAAVVIDGVTGETPPSGTAGSAPEVLTAKGLTISVAVSFHDAAGNLTSFGKATDVKLVTSQGTGGDVITTVEAADTGTTLTSSAFTAAANRVTATVSVPGLKGKNAVPAVTSATLFDVLSTLTSVPTTTTNYVRQVSRTGGTSCGDITETNPYCATVLLPKGAGAGAAPIAVGTGLCDSSYTSCPAGSYVVELLADLGSYTATEPATVILDCDKKFCGKGSIQSNVPNFAVGGDDAMSDLGPCAAKGVAPASGACVDYVQSTRDNAGDTHLWVLFARDARMSCC